MTTSHTHDIHKVRAGRDSALVRFICRCGWRSPLYIEGPDGSLS